MMCCEEVMELLPIYVGGGLAPRARADIAAHIAVCGECRGEAVRLFRLKSELTGQSPLSELPSELDPFALLPKEPGLIDELREGFGDSLEQLERVRRTVKLSFRLASMR